MFSSGLQLDDDDEYDDDYNDDDDFQGVTSLFSAGLQLEENSPLLVLYKLAEALNILRSGGISTFGRK